MRANREKIEIAMARKCMNTAELIAATQMPRATVVKVVNCREVRPATIGRVAKALCVDVTELLEDESR